MSLRESADKAGEKAIRDSDLRVEKVTLENPREISRGWLILPGVGQALDLGTTLVGLDKGAREANPLIAPLVDKVPVFIAVKLGLGIAQGFLIKSLADNGHKRAAKIISAVSFGAGALPAIHNIGVIRKQ